MEPDFGGLFFSTLLYRVIGRVGILSIEEVSIYIDGVCKYITTGT